MDKRTDIWAFGCVLFEMLTWRRAFGGDEVTDVLAFIITKAPDAAALPPAVPPIVRRLLEKCLAKERRSRLADISDARLDILDIEEALAAPVAPDARTRDDTGTQSARRLQVAAAIALLIAAGVSGSAVWMMTRGAIQVARSVQEVQHQPPQHSDLPRLYEIVALIDAGGMGEVCRAHDTRLGRDVAIKVLPDAFAQDAEPWPGRDAHQIER